MRTEQHIPADVAEGQQVDVAALWTTDRRLPADAYHSSERRVSAARCADP
jgi:hypothetical protein